MYVKFWPQLFLYYRKHKLTSASAHDFNSLKYLKHCVPNFSQPTGHLRPMLKGSAKNILHVCNIKLRHLYQVIDEMCECKKETSSLLIICSKVGKFSLFIYLETWLHLQPTQKGGMLQKSTCWQSPININIIINIM